MSPHASLPYDLIVLDIDGTLLDLYGRPENGGQTENGGVSRAVLRAIADVRRAGIPVTVASGRTLDYIREKLPALELTQPVVTAQGAVVGDPQTGRVLAMRALPLRQALDIAAWAADTARATVFYFADETGEGSTQIYQNCTEDDPAFRDPLLDHLFGTPRIPYPDFLDLLSAPDASPPIKFITLNDMRPSSNEQGAAEADLAPVLQKRFGPAVHITRTHPILVEGTARGVDKGTGLETLCQLLDIDPARVLAIGDSDNDIPVLERAGTAIAMGDATEGVLAVADWVAPGVGEDGVAVALQKFVLDRLG